MNRIELARQMDYIREAGDNAGCRVEAIQKWRGGEKGESWCCDWATMVLDIEFKGQSPIPRLGACQDVYDLAKEKGWLIPKPEVGCLFLYITDADHAHHIGFVTGVSPLTGIAGNTSADGTSSNGDGVHEHPLNVPLARIRFVRVTSVA